MAGPKKDVKWLLVKIHHISSKRTQQYGDNSTMGHSPRRLATVQWRPKIERLRNFRRDLEFLKRLDILKIMDI